LYTGNSSTQTITNNIDLSGKGGLVWLKKRGPNANYGNPSLWDTVRGVNNVIYSDQTTLQQNYSPYGLTAFSSTGFSVSDPGNYGVNGSGDTYVSWTFRKQAKFFDVVTYTGNGVDGRTITHNLGASPGFVIVKRTDTTGNWVCLFVDNGPVYAANLLLNSTAAAYNSGQNSGRIGSPTSTTFTTYLSGGSLADVNASGGTYVAYLFASNAGGFGSAGTDNVITCGSYTTDGSGNGSVTLGYEPQFVLDRITTVGDWRMFDNMRGIATDGVDARLLANDIQAEYSAYDVINLTSTGFTTRLGSASTTYIYIAIRRGPMATPTTGTSVFSPYTYNTPANGTQVTTSFPVSMGIWKNVDGGPSGQLQDRLRGFPPNSTTGSPALYPESTIAESSNYTAYNYWNTGFLTNKGANDVWWSFQRAPGFFDEVCYTGDGVSGRAITHNLTVAPEFIITKNRGRNGTSWTIWNKDLPSGYVLILNYANPQDNGWGTNYIGTPNATSYQVGTTERVNNSGDTYVAYLFATVAGVSKVGTFTGTGGTQTVNCGFGAGGARWLLVKRTDSTGDWYVFDSARGFTSSSSPYLLMNSTAAQTTGNNGCYAASTGFTVTSTASATVNINGASYIYVSVA
jgi:hypothetical protein